MPKIVDHQQYRKELSIKCFSLFSKKGYSNVTMRQISTELGVSTGLLYHYFSTKEAIFESTINLIKDQDYEQARLRFGGEMPFESKLELFIAFMDEKKEYYQNLLLLVIDFYRSKTDRDTEKLWNHFAGFYKQVICTNLGLPENLGTPLLAALLGLVLHCIAAPATTDFKKEATLLGDMLSAYLTNLKIDKENP